MENLILHTSNEDKTKETVGAAAHRLLLNPDEKQGIVDTQREVDKTFLGDLERLSGEYPLDLLTSGERNKEIKKLEKIGINPNLFDYFLASENGSKTYGTQFIEWVEKRNSQDPKNFLYVGDNKRQDVDSPTELGIITCFVGKYNRADFEIENIMGLEKLLL